MYRGGAAWQWRFWKFYVQVNKPLILDRRKLRKACTPTLVNIDTWTRTWRRHFRNTGGLHPRCWTVSSKAWAVFPPSSSTIRGIGSRTKHFSPLRQAPQSTRMALERQVRAKVWARGFSCIVRSFGEESGNILPCARSLQLYFAQSHPANSVVNPSIVNIPLVPATLTNNPCVWCKSSNSYETNSLIRAMQISGFALYELANFRAMQMCKIVSRESMNLSHASFYVSKGCAELWSSELGRAGYPCFSLAIETNHCESRNRYRWQQMGRFTGFDV